MSDPTHASWPTRPTPLDARAELAGKYVDLFWSKVDKTDECWHWTGALARSGYGVYGVRQPSGPNRQWKAHRLAWSLVNGPIPPEMLVCHRCDNPPCVRPDHLFLGTPGDNMRDMVTKGRCRPGPKPGHCAGERNGHSKVTNDQRRAICLAYAAGEGSQSQLARRYGLTQATVSKIIRSPRRWAEYTGTATHEEWTDHV